MPITLPNNPYPICQNFDNWYKNWNCTDCDCNLKIIKDIFNNITMNKKQPRSCAITQYSGKMMSDRIYKKYQIEKWFGYSQLVQINYYFAKPLVAQVYNEYIIFDTIGMIGAVGGTLGLFIGFSFNNVIDYLLGYLKWFTTKIFKKKANSIINQETPAIRVEECQRRFTKLEMQIAKMQKAINDLQPIRASDAE